VVENSFTSIGDMVSVVLPALRLFKPMISSKWPSVETIRKVTAPVLFISGQKDELVPPSHMKRLRDAATATRFAEFHEFPDGTHNFTWSSPSYYQIFGRFLQRVFDGEEW